MSGEPDGGGRYTPGDPVRLVHGPYADFPGVVLSVEGGWLIVEVDVFGRTTRVELRPTDVEPRG